MLSFNEIENELRKTVMGQDEAIKELTSVFIRHSLRQYAKEHNINLSSVPSLLLYGNTGSGKTFLLKEFSRVFNMPIIFINSTSISQEGWQGKSFIEQVMEQYRATPQATIIVLDEFDKLIQPNMASGSNISNFLQQSLLAYLDGIEVIDKGIKIDTNNFLFIFTGAFDSLLNKKENKNIGFTEEMKENKDSFYKEMQKYGAIPELLGRIKTTIKMNPITKETYKNLLDNAEFPPNKWITFLSLFSPKSYFYLDKDKIINNSIETNLGVRGLLQQTELEINRQIEENKDTLDFKHLKSGQ